MKTKQVDESALAALFAPPPSAEDPLAWLETATAKPAVAPIVADPPAPSPPPVAAPDPPAGTEMALLVAGPCPLCGAQIHWFHLDGTGPHCHRCNDWPNEFSVDRYVVALLDADGYWAWEPFPVRSNAAPDPKKEPARVFLEPDDWYQLPTSASWDQKYQKNGWSLAELNEYCRNQKEVKSKPKKKARPKDTLI